MCETFKELGSIVTVAPADQIPKIQESYLVDLEELVRAKTGKDTTRARDDEGRFYCELTEDRAFGKVPSWCRRSIDRADPRKLRMYFTTKPQDDEVEFKAFLIELLD